MLREKRSESPHQAEDDRIDLFDDLLELFEKSLAESASGDTAWQTNLLTLYEKVLVLFKRVTASTQDSNKKALRRKYEQFTNDVIRISNKFLEETPIESKKSVAGSVVLKSFSRLLLRLARFFEEHKSGGNRSLILAEVGWLEDVISGRIDVCASDSNGKPDYYDEIQGIRCLRFLILQEHVKVRMLQAEGIGQLDENNASVCFQLYRDLEKANQTFDQYKGKFFDLEIRDFEDCFGLVDRECCRLKKLFFSFADSANNAKAIFILVSVAENLVVELDEARVSVLEEEDPAVLESLKHFQKMADDFIRIFRSRISVCKQMLRESEDGLKARSEKALKELVRMNLRVRKLFADRVLRNRLNAVFGKRMVRFWETFIFVLVICAVCLLFTGGQAGEEKIQGITWIVWADTAICAVLLLDFATRWVLSPNRFLFLRRRFLTELVPAIPFLLLANIDQVGTLSSVKLLRLFRVFRVLGAWRFLFSIIRIILFGLRTMDRFVEKHAAFLNRKIVFFGQPAKACCDSPLERMHGFQHKIGHTVKHAYQNFSDEDQLAVASLSKRFVEMEISYLSLENAGVEMFYSDRVNRRARELDVNDVIEVLRSADGSTVADTVGKRFAENVMQLVRFLRLPVLNRLAATQYILGVRRFADPLFVTARLGRVCGDCLAILQNAAIWVTDLYGSITGPQFLDRVGLQLMQATAQPAKRLIGFSLLLALALLLVQLPGLGFLDELAMKLSSIIWGPVVIIGVVCLVPLIFGAWLRRIAGEATDYYDRIADAQFLSMTEVTKDENADRYLEYLAKRVILPEVAMNRGNVKEEASLIKRFSYLGINAPLLDNIDDLKAWGSSWEHTNTVLLFYRSFVDGSFFHRNDVKLANLLVGNLTLENVRHNRLGYSKKEKKVLTQLDMGRRKGGLRGPYVWFNLITHSISQFTARLILDYNQNCIPLDEISASDEQEKERYRHWIEDKSERGRKGGNRAGGRNMLRLETPYRTTEFNALHFLTINEQRDASIRRRYGEKIYQLMRQDRKNMIRTVFGSYPLQDIPKEKRTLNPFEFYMRYFARGRIFLMPFRLFWYALKGFNVFLLKTIKTVKYVLTGDLQAIAFARSCSDFSIARRKIDRMRRPVVMEALRLRVAFDFQYLGLGLPERFPVVTAAGKLDEDLDKLRATVCEAETVKAVKKKRAKQLRLLERMFDRTEETGLFFKPVLLAANPNLEGREGEAMRALITAFTCDFQNTFSILHALDELLRIINRVVKNVSKEPDIKVSCFNRMRLKKYKPLVDASWPILYSEFRRTSEQCSIDEEELKIRFALRIARCDRKKKACLQILKNLKPKENDPYTHVFYLLMDVAEKPFSWSEQIVAVRSIQSLGILDIMEYESVIKNLGDY